jgi:hypothetical protein
VRDEGGDLAARHAAINIVKSELALMREGKLLGGVAPWFIHNPLSRRVEFMHLQTRFADAFQQSWSATKKEVKHAISLKEEKGAGAREGEQTPLKVAAPGKRLLATTDLSGKKVKLELGAGEGSGAGKPSSSSGGKLETADDQKKGRKKGTNPKKEEDDDDKKAAIDKAKKKEEMKQLNDLKALKNKVLTAGAAGKAVLDLIKTSPDWSYFNNEANTNGLTLAMFKMDEFFKTNTFWQSFGVIEATDFIKAARKEYGEDAFSVQFARKAELEVLILSVVRETTFLKKMKAARA